MSGGRAVFEAINGPAPGKFLETSRGTTHYVLEGPEDAPMLVVLQHGIGGALSLGHSRIRRAGSPLFV